MQSKTKATHVAPAYTTPVITLKMEVVSYIEDEFVLGHGGKTVGQHVDAMIAECMNDDVQMRALVINLSDMSRK